MSYRLRYQKIGKSQSNGKKVNGSLFCFYVLRYDVVCVTSIATDCIILEMDKHKIMDLPLDVFVIIIV